ncbi:MAG: toll/interleukin-1 receptor domain-containing protein [Bacteroidales bacterium]|jgi:hypothetical protein
MSLPINKRDFDVFLSHAHTDHVFVEVLDRWLTEKAGMTVWYDSRELSGGAALATGLQKGIERCRAIIIVVTSDAFAHGWVKAEYNAAMDERANFDGFRVIALRIGNFGEQDLMKGVTWIDVPEARLDRNTALALMRAFYPGEKCPNPATSRDVFISCSWHPDDSVSARTVCKELVGEGFRLIGDARDQKGFGKGDRVEDIILSCGAFVGIIPFRGIELTPDDESPYKYFLREIDFATTHGIPSLIVVDPRIQRIDDKTSTWLPMETSATECPGSVAVAIKALWEDWDEPERPHYIFYALDLTSDAARPGGPIRHLIERITGMRTIVGDEIHEEPLNSAIMKSLGRAFLVLADLTDDNLNACIEAGMALVWGTNIELIAYGKPKRPPFMLRTLQMSTYQDDVDQIGIINKILRPYRRRIINTEL